MENLTEKQIKFFKHLTDIQEFFVTIELNDYKKGNSLKSHLYSITYNIIYHICEILDGYNSNISYLQLIDKETNKPLRNGIELHDTCYDFLKQDEEYYKIYPQIMTKNQIKFFKYLSYLQENCTLNILNSYKENDNIESLLYNITYDIIYYICEIFDNCNYLQLIDKETNMYFANGIKLKNICCDFIKKYI